MKHLFFSGVIILLLFVSPVYSQNYQETELGAKISLPSQEAEIQFFNSSIVRILKYPKGTAINKESVSVIKTERLSLYKSAELICTFFWNTFPRELFTYSMVFFSDAVV